MSTQQEHARAREAYAAGRAQREGARLADGLTRGNGAASAQAGGGSR